METLPDADVIAASEKDPSQFAVIFDRHFKAILGYLTRRVGVDVADDLAAESFVVAFGRRASYEPNRPDARPWLFGIAANLLRHHRRTERRQLLAYARTGLDPVSCPFDGIEERVDAGAEGPKLALALASLPARDCDVLLLYAWADLSYEEIAEALAIPVGTVRSRLFRARRHVRELLLADGQFEGERLSVEGGRNG